MYAQSWNVSLQRELPGNIVAGASYAGLQMTHVWTLQALSPAIYFPQASCTLNGVTYTPCSSTANTNQRRRYSLERPQDGQYMAFYGQTGRRRHAELSRIDPYSGSAFREGR